MAGVFKKGGLVNTSLFTGIHSAINIASGFVVNKVIAYYLGPPGLALVSQFQNFIESLSSFTSSGVSRGAVKFIAEHKTKEDELKKILPTATILTVVISLICSLILFVFNVRISEFLFENTDDTLYVNLLSVSIIFFSLTELLVSILNGYQLIPRYTLVNIVRSLSKFGLTAFFAIVWGVKGALVALSVSQILAFLVSFVLVVRAPFIREMFQFIFNKKLAWQLMTYSLFAIVYGVLFPYSQILIRNHIIDTLSNNDAGYWDSVWKLSASYLSFINMTMTVYFLPKLAQTINKKEMTKELFSGFKIVLPFTLVVLGLIYLLSDQIILLLFTKEFLPATQILLPFLIGSFISIYANFYHFVFMAKSQMILYTFLQVILIAATYLISVWLINDFGLIGASYGFLIISAIKAILFTGLYIYKDL